MTRNNLGQFSRSVWAKIKSTIKFTFWFLGFLFTKEGLKQTLWVLGLALTTAFLLLQFELQSWHTAVDFTTQLFNKPVEDVSVNIPHAQDTYQNLIRWTFGKDYKTALAVATAENGTHACDRIHQNSNGTVDIGIFQINSVHAHKGNLYDCRDNVRVAYQIFKASGFSAWVAYKNKSYLKFL